MYLAHYPSVCSSFVLHESVAAVSLFYDDNLAVVVMSTNWELIQSAVNTPDTSTFVDTTSVNLPLLVSSRLSLSVLTTLLSTFWRRACQLRLLCVTVRLWLVTNDFSPSTHTVCALVKSLLDYGFSNDTTAPISHGGEQLVSRRN